MHFLQSVKEVGRFQYMVILIFMFGIPPTHWTNQGIIILAPKIKHWCMLHNETWTNFSDNEKDERYNVCELDQNKTTPDYSNSSVKCDHLVYDHSQFQYTATERFHLSCSRRYLISLAATIYMSGYFVSCAVSGPFSDNFGRKTLMLVSVIGGAISNAISAFMPNFIGYLICRFFMALFDTGFNIAAIVLTTEIVRQDQRLISKLADSIMTDIAYLLLGCLSLVLSDYRYIHIIVTCIYFILFFLVWKFVCESPRWLAVKNRQDLALNTIRHIAEFNKCSLDKLEHLHYLQTENSPQQSVNFFTILKYPNLRKRALVWFPIWFFGVLTYYALTYNLGDFTTDVRIGLLISGAIEIPFVIVPLLMTRKFGRQITMFVFFVLAGVFCLLMTPLIENTSSPFLLVLALGGKLMMSGGGFVIYIFTQETFPTIIRSSGLGACSTIGRISGMAAPQLSLLNQFWPPLMVVLIGTMGLFSAMLIPFLPDTSYAELGQTLADGNRYRSEHVYKLEMPRKPRVSDVGLQERSS